MDIKYPTAGITDIVVWEKKECVGGTWRESTYPGAPCVEYFNETVTDAHYEAGKWTVKTNQAQTYLADFIVFAKGIFHHPKFPDIPGLKDIKGSMFHTGQWNHDVQMSASTRVGLIGTGSTAAQAGIPELINIGAKGVMHAYWVE